MLHSIEKAANTASPWNQPRARRQLDPEACNIRIVGLPCRDQYLQDFVALSDCYHIIVSALPSCFKHQ